MPRFPSPGSRTALLAVALAAFLVGCEEPTSPVGVGEESGLVASAHESRGGGKGSLVPQPADPPVCAEPWDDTRVLCRAAVNAKHGNAQGLPLNLRGVRNGNGSGGTLMVTVLGTLEFNLAAVDLGTLRVGDVETNPPSTPLVQLPNGKYQASVVDVNGDRILDLVLHFRLTEMVANGDLSESTTELCLYGEGPGYVLNGCGVPGGEGGGDDEGDGGEGGGDDGDGDGGDGDPAYLCPDGYKPKRGNGCVVLQPFGAGADVGVAVLQVPSWLTDAEDPTHGYPGWTTTPAANLPGTGTSTGRRWTLTDLNLGTDNSGNDFLTGTCGLPTSSYRWGNKEQLLVRSDLTVPAEAVQVLIELVVDDGARVFFNGTEVTRGWVVGNGDAEGCRSYADPNRVTVPASLLSGGALNALGVWAADAGGFVNYLDVRVFAEVPLP